MSEKIQRRFVDTGRDGAYRAVGDLRWCEEHEAWESDAFHKALMDNPELLKEIEED